jgi:hypothetical protein
MSDNVVTLAMVICFFGWIPLLALVAGISWILEAWRTNN